MQSRHTEEDILTAAPFPVPRVLLRAVELSLALVLFSLLIVILGIKAEGELTVHGDNGLECGRRSNSLGSEGSKV